MEEKGRDLSETLLRSLALLRRGAEGGLEDEAEAGEVHGGSKSRRAATPVEGGVSDRCGEGRPKGAQIPRVYWLFYVR